MGHSQAQKADTHRRIVEVAARRFLEVGLEGIGVAEVMKEAGVTVGGFYKHFGSRDDLVVEAVALAIDRIEGLQAKAQSLLDFLDFYLSEIHRDGPGAGCAFVALMGDVARNGGAVRTLYTERVERTIAFVESFLPLSENVERRDRALFIVSSCVGALGLSRAVADPDLSRQILRSTRTQIVELLASSDERSRGISMP